MIEWKNRFLIFFSISISAPRVGHWFFLTFFQVFSAETGLKKKVPFFSKNRPKFWWVVLRGRFIVPKKKFIRQGVGPKNVVFFDMGNKGRPILAKIEKVLQIFWAVNKGILRFALRCLRGEHFFIEKTCLILAICRLNSRFSIFGEGGHFLDWW